MSMTTPDRETVDILLDLGGEPFKICYQCGTCTGTCPWNLVKDFVVRKLMLRNAGFLMAAGILLTDRKSYDRALRCYQRVTEIHPTYRHAWNDKGLVLYYLERYEEALQSYEEALDLDPLFKEAWYNKGLALEKLGRSVEAEDAFLRAEDLGV